MHLCGGYCCFTALQQALERSGYGCHVPASQAGIFTTMLPISAFVVGGLLGEQINLIQWIALGLSLFAVVLVTKK